MKNAHAIQELLKGNCQIIGPLEMTFSNAAPFNEATNGEITWMRRFDDKASTSIKQSPASIIICDDRLNWSEPQENKTLILVQHPQLAFREILLHFFSPQQQDKPSIHPSAIINPRAKVGRNVEIGPYCVIGECEIGDDVRVGSFVRIYDRVSIGARTQIFDHCNIGGEGFGHIKTTDGWKNMPHVGRVVIESDVEIFPYVNIDSGTLGTTWIKKGAKIDHYCHIAHNVTVGSNSAVAAGVILCGSSKVSEDCWIGVGAMVRESIQIGKSATIGMGAIVLKDVPEEEIWVGNPAKKLIKP